jgi:exopolysaccharide biosynthesis polyprenyl glycosylphosphotransferase
MPNEPSLALLAESGPSPEAPPNQRDLLHRLPAAYFFAATDGVLLAIPACWTPQHSKAIVLVAVLSIVFLWAGGMYRPRIRPLFLDDLPGFVSRLLAAAGLVGTLTSLRHNGASDLVFLKSSAEGIVLALFGHLLATFTVRTARRWGLVEHRTILVGSGPVTERIATTLLSPDRCGLTPVAYLADDEAGTESNLGRLPYLGDVGRLWEAIDDECATVVIVSDAGFASSRLTALCRQAIIRHCDLFIVPRMHEVTRHGPATETIGAIPVVRFGSSSRDGLPWKFKRFFDVVVSLTALILLSPLLLVCSILVRIDSGPGILFRQVRVGRDGIPFELLKFRSLRPANDVEAATTWSVGTDDRISTIGRWLRRTSIDELPQLWNILRGDMTFVGPRPERPFFVEKFSAEEPSYAFRHRVPSGLTGLAQVNGMRGDTSIAERSSFDNYYIENWSLWLDVKVILRTVGEVVGARGR